MEEFGQIETLYWYFFLMYNISQVAKQKKEHIKVALYKNKSFSYKTIKMKEIKNVQYSH